MLDDLFERSGCQARPFGIANLNFDLCAGDSDWDDYAPTSGTYARAKLYEGISEELNSTLDSDSNKGAVAAPAPDGDLAAPWAIAVFIFVVAVGIFSNTANHDFTFDDQVCPVSA